MLTERELFQAQGVLVNLSKPVTLIVYIGEEDEYSREMANFARQLTGIAGGEMHLHYGEGVNLPGLPAIKIICGNQDNINYMALPTGPELKPFLNTLAILDRKQAPVSAAAAEYIEQISRPAQVKILISPTCQNCPKVVSNVNSVAALNPQVQVTIIDITHFMEIGLHYNARSAPTTIIDEKFTIIGELTSEKFARILAQRGTLKHVTETIKSMLNTGRAEDASFLILAMEDMETFMPLYLAEDMSTRMAMMLAMEEVLEIDPRGLDKFLPELIGLMEHSDHRIRGDTADLLGKIGSPEAIPALKKAASDKNPDVAEAAEDALQEIATGTKYM
jgi:hypothetical protein